MGTKLKSFSYNTWVKTAAFIVAVISFGAAIATAFGLIATTRGAHQLFAQDYLSSAPAQRNVETIYVSVDGIFKLRNEDYIVNQLGAAALSGRIQERLAKLEAAKNHLATVEGIYYYASDGENTFTNCEMTTAAQFREFELYNIADRHRSESTISFYVDRYIAQQQNHKVYIALESGEDLQDRADTMYSHLYNLMSLKSEQYIYEKTQREIEEESQDMQRELAQHHQQLSALEGIYYYATNGEVQVGNCDKTTAEQFRAFKHHNIIDGYTVDLKIGDSSGGFTAFAPNTKVFIAYDDGFAAERQEQFQQAKAFLQDGTWAVALLLSLSLALLLYLMFVCGKSDSPNVHGVNMLVIDRLWTELTIVALLAAMGAYVAFGANSFQGSSVVLFAQVWPAVTAITAAVCAFCLMLLLSVVRHIKNASLIKSSLIYKVCRWLHSMIKYIAAHVFNTMPLNIKIITAIVVAELAAVVLTAMLLAAIGGGFFFTYLVLMAVVTIGIIYLVHKQVIKPYDDEVKARLELSLDRAIKAERMKADLITNVSHDIKTPLTAIINYSDLLVRQDENNEYAKIVYEKSQKLKTLSDDLFEVTKAQSGNIAVDHERLNLLELLNQTMAEFDQLTLDFKIDIANSLTISADSKLMSRVFENLVGNMIKYSLPNTRAYIQASEKDGKVRITFKNIANYEMAFDSNDIIERFSRGDASRTAEGNGLGLAIAQSYTEACGGKLEIQVDGDLFKATLIF